MAVVGEDGKANGTETGDDLFTKTGWSKFNWETAASWTGSSDVNWGAPEHKNTPDLLF